MTDKNVLFDTVKLGNSNLLNRVGVAPMTRISATSEGLATEEMASYYASFAHGGFGLIIIEGTYTDELYSQCYRDQGGLANDEQAQSWKKVVDAIHQAGAKVIIQLQHAGALSQGNRFTDQHISSSAIQPLGEQIPFYGGHGAFLMPREATKEDIKDIMNGFVEAALRAKSAGFDGVELHGANGYLLDQFLTDYTNHRTDEYGGSTENRVRLLVEVSSAVREAVGPDFTVGIRISQSKLNNYAYKWTDKQKDAAIIFGQLGQAGLDYIHVTEYQALQPAFPDGSEETLADYARKYGKITVIANGHLADPAEASKMIASGKADVITLGKGALANHDWVNKVKNGEPLVEFDPALFLRPNAKLKEFEI